jgi:polyhydroxybutyrate depolymerase
MKIRSAGNLRRSLLFLSLLGMFTAGCTATLPRDHVMGPKTYEGTVDIRIRGFRRTYLVHVPPGDRPETPVPLVVVLHGAFDTAEGMEKTSGFSRLADRERFIVLYPNGMGILGFLQHWNAGHCCGKAADDRLDDVGFVAAAIEDASARLNVDRDRVYMAGFSNGGMLAYRFAAERGDLLAAVAPMAASIGGKPSGKAPEWRIPDPVRRLPILVVHGLSDNVVPYAGGSPAKGGSRTYWSAEESVKFWVARNGCSPQGTDRSLKDGAVRMTSWAACNDNADVALLLIKDWGHVWPGKHFTAALPEGDPLRDFDAAEILWDFFRSHPRR